MSSNRAPALVVLALLGTALLVQRCHRPVREVAQALSPRAGAAERRAPDGGPARRWLSRAVSPTEMCTTLGALREGASGEFAVQAPALRLYVPGSSGAEAALRFRYHGQTETTSALRSGERREQLGLRLFGHDTCNALYVMWRLRPTPQLVVSLKRNPGQTRHAECENRGYRSLRGERTRPLAALEPGSVHELRASVRDARLSVWVDRELAWEGALEAGALPALGCAGLRSDNVRFDVLELSAEMGSERPDAATCRGAWLDEHADAALP